MRQAIWIFRKDVRHLRIQIAITIVLQCAFTLSNILSSPLQTPETARMNSLALWSGVFLVLSWWYLLALAVHDEALPGSCQFWLTRPYSWRSLLASKLLFAFAFINLPTFIFDCVFLGAQSFPVLRSIPALLFRQIPFSLLFILPAVVLAALSSGIPQLLMGVLLIAAGWLIEATVFSRGHGIGVSVDVFSGNWIDQWIYGAIFFTIALAILFWVYRTRRTTQIRSLSAALLLLAPFWSPIPLTSARNLAFFKSRTPSANTADIQLSSRVAPRYIAPTPSNSLEINLPLTVSGLPPETSLEGVERDLRYRRSGQSRFEELNFGAFLARRPDGYWLTIRIDPRQYGLLRPQLVTLRATLSLTLITAKPVVQLSSSSSKSVRVADLGDCGLVKDAFPTPPGLICRAAVWTPQRTEVQVKSGPTLVATVATGSNFSSPCPVMTGLSPVDKWFLPLTTSEVAENQLRAVLENPSSQLVFVPQYPLGHLERTLDIQNLRLEDYVSIFAGTVSSQ